MQLVLGVLDQRYSDANGGDGSTTTGDVAEILEQNYHVMQTFFDLRRDKIAGYLADSVRNAIADLVSGRRVASEPTFDGAQKVEAEFRAFLDANEMAQLDAQYGRVLSAAAAAGVNHRKKRPYAKANKARPAFIDTGLYRASFRAWVEKGTKDT